MRFSLSLLALVPMLLCVSLTTAAPVQLYGLNYNTRQGPDWDPNRCKSREQIRVDLAMIRKLTNRMRVLSLADCDQAELVLDVLNNEQEGMQVWLGMWVSQNEDVFEEEVQVLESLLERGLITSETVLGITVGSEAIYREEVTVAENIAYMERVKNICLQAGFDGPVTVVDIAPTYQYNPQLTEAVDVVMTNSFPFWESIPVPESTDYLVEEIEPIQNQPQNNNRPVIVGETGWPSDGYNENVGRGSPEFQTEYFKQFYCRMDQELNWQYYWFAAIDSAWRQLQDPDNTIEGNWGFMYANLTVKPHFRDFVFTCPSSPSTEYSFEEIDWSIPSSEGQASTPTPTETSPPQPQTSAPPTSSPTVIENTMEPTPEPTALTPSPTTESGLGNLLPEPSLSPTSNTTVIENTMEPTPEPTASTTLPPTIGTDQPTVSTSQPTTMTPQPTTMAPTVRIGTPQPTTSTPQPSTLQPTTMPTTSGTENGPSSPSPVPLTPSPTAIPSHMPSVGETDDLSPSPSISTTESSSTSAPSQQTASSSDDLSLTDSEEAETIFGSGSTRMRPGNYLTGAFMIGVMCFSYVVVV